MVAAAAIEAGVSRLFRIGGAHAIAALAYGTGRVPRVDKIVGPGNRYVAAAKAHGGARLPDRLRGRPDGTRLGHRQSPARVGRAATSLAQAEHDPDARAFLVTTSRRQAEAVRDALVRLAPSSGVAATALAINGAALVARSRGEVLETRESHRARAPGDDDEWRGGARRPLAGTVFVGALARARGGRLRHRVEPRAADGGRRAVSRRAHRGRLRACRGRAAPDAARGSRGIAAAAITMAGVEGLTAHAASIEARLR